MKKGYLVALILLVMLTLLSLALNGVVIFGLLRAQEIALTFTFPQTGQTIKATGEVVRITHEGVGVEIKLFFNE